MNELLCGSGRRLEKAWTGQNRPGANITSNHDLKHYPDTWARAEPEADDTDYVAVTQLRPLADQVLTGASAKSLRDLSEETTTTDLCPPTV